MSRLNVLAALCLSSSLIASDAREPYQVRIVVDVARHPLLTDVFKDQIQRELRDGVQAALGRLARVEVTDKHPQLPTIRADGLLKALNAYRERSNYQVHFVQIDFSGTHYQIDTRRHDGATGLPSPVVRSGRTGDRAFVARQAAFLLERELGLLGTIASEPNENQQVRVDLKGGWLGTDLARWIKKGEVFQVVRIDGPGAGEADEGAYLQVVEPAREGACTCKLYSRFKVGGFTGMRAVLLGTRSGPLKLRVYQEGPDGRVRSVAGLVTLHIRKHGFDGEEASKLYRTVSPKRIVTTEDDPERGTFDRLAFVTVLNNEKPIARIPVPILDDSVTPLPVPVVSEADNGILTTYRFFRRGVFDADSIQRNQFDKINKLNASPERRAETLKEVKSALQRVRQDHPKFTREFEALKEALNKLDAKDRPAARELEVIKEKLDSIKAGEKELLEYLASVEKLEKEENDPKKKEWGVRLKTAELLVREAELGKALDVYDKVPAEFLSPELKTRIAELRALWKPKDDDHAKARKFIFETWPGLDTAGIKARLKEAEDSFAACVKVGDLVGPAKLSRALKQHLENMGKELDSLKPGTNVDDERPAQTIKDLLPDLQRFDRQLQTYLDKSAGKKE